MIENDEQLRNTLEYLTKWANALEGMRRHADETEPNFLSQGIAGPIAEICKGLDESRLYLRRHASPAAKPTGNGDYTAERNEIALSETDTVESIAAAIQAKKTPQFPAKFPR